MTQIEHTPITYTNSPFEDGMPYIRITGELEESYPWDLTGIMPVNIADRIVKAYNEYDKLKRDNAALLEALKLMRDTFASQEDDFDGFGLEHFKKVDAAIKQAEEA